MCGCSRLPGATVARVSYPDCNWTLEDLNAILNQYETITTLKQKREKYIIQQQIKIFNRFPCKYYKKIIGYVTSTN